MSDGIPEKLYLLEWTQQHQKTFRTQEEAEAFAAIITYGSLTAENEYTITQIDKRDE